MRRLSTTLLLMAAFTVALALAAVAGLRTAPSDELYDTRRSTFLSGPEGARGMAQALEELGVTVERWRRPFYGVAADSLRPDSTAWLALLGLSPQPVETGHLFSATRVVSDAERRELMRYFKRGGAMLLAGISGVEDCFGMEVIPVRSGGERESRVVGPPGSDSLPAARYVWRAIDSEQADAECAAPAVLNSRLLLRTVDGEAVVWRHLLKGGGRVILMADSRYVSNRFMRDTDAGPVVLRWILDEEPSRLIVDEYHQGFAVGGSIFAAAWGWTRRSPAGWAMLQLALAGLVALTVAAVRFGPALRIVERRRRSPLEHLDALAVGLERSAGDAAAVRLIAGGLRRRLSRSGHVPRGGRDDMQWLDALGLAARSADARRAVQRLGRVLRERDGDGRVLDAATAVEDVWQALRPADGYRRS